MLTDKDEILKWLEEHNIKYKNISIDENGVVNASQIYFFKDKENPVKIPKLEVQFGKVHYFEFSGAGLTTLEGCPHTCYKFVVASNDLYDLDFFPTSIDKYVDISNNHLTKIDFNKVKLAHISSGGGTIGLSRNHLIISKEDIKTVYRRKVIQKKFMQSITYSYTYPHWVMKKYAKEVFQMVKDGVIEESQIKIYDIWRK